MTLSPPLLAIGLLAAAALGYEVLLLRLLNIIQSPHFAAMTVSMALLGYSASGTLLSLTRHWATQRFPSLFAFHATLFGFTTLLGFLLAQNLAINIIEFSQNWRQLLYLTLIYLLLATPFFFAGNAIGLSLFRFRQQIGNVYSANLIGAGIGALGILGLLFLVPPLLALKILGALGIIAAILGLWLANRSVSPLWRGDSRRGDKIIKGEGGWLAMMLGIAAIFVIFSMCCGNIEVAPSKALSQTLQLPGSHLIEEDSSPFGSLAIVENQSQPFHYAPGLSTHHSHQPLDQLGVFTDGNTFTVINRHNEQPHELDHLDFLTSALPYQFLDKPKVLILGVGGGSQLLQALAHDANYVDAVESNPQLVDLVKRRYTQFAGHIYNHRRVDIHIAQARGFVTTHNMEYDLIQLALLDSINATTVEPHALQENYLYTVEAFQELLTRLRPQGLLAITQWLKLPPRESLKLVATAIAAWCTSSNEKIDVTQRLILIYNKQTVTLLIKNGEFTPMDVAKLHQFRQQRSFDVAYYPGISPHEVNQFNWHRHPDLYEGVIALLSAQRENFLTNYKYNLIPATDNRPYFFNFFTWTLVPELLFKSNNNAVGTLERSYLSLLTTLLLATLLTITLILLALLIRKSTVQRVTSKQLAQILTYFLCLGIASIFTELAFMQQFVLHLHIPLPYATSIVLSSFLIFAGLGSHYSNQLISRQRRFFLNPLMTAGISIIVLILLYITLLPSLLPPLAFFPIAVKLILSWILMAPLAFLMGIPFPLGIAYLGECLPKLIPWVWAINGSATALSAMLLTMLTIHLGFTGTIFIAMGLYGVATLSLPIFHYQTNR